MNSKRDQRNTQDGLEPKEECCSLDQGAKLYNSAKIQNEACQEDLNLNNNIENSGDKCPLFSDKSNALSNGSQASRSNKFSSDSQSLKLKFPLNTNSTKNLNASMASSDVASNHVCKSVPHNSMSDSFTCTSVPNFLDSLPGISSEDATATEDTEIRNNVDYATRIEKCPPKVSCSSDSSPDADRACSSSSYQSSSILNNIGSSIGSTSHGTCCVLKPNINSNSRDNGAGPSGLSKRILGDRRDSSSGNEGDLSDGEDYCIYTYKGNDDSTMMVQRPDQMQARENGELDGHQSGRSSPEMDFLEMDFDPGPSCEQDTGDSDLASISEDIQNIAMDNIETDPVLLNDLSGGKVVARQTVSQLPRNTPENERNVNSQQTNDQEHDDQQSSCMANPIPKQVYTEPCCQPSTSGSIKTWEATSMYRHSAACPLQQSYGYHNTSGDLISPGDNRDTDAELWAENSAVSVPENSNLNSHKINLSSNLYHRMMAKKLMLNKQTAFNQSGDSNLESEICNERLDGLIPVEKVMLWTEQEAIAKQVTQIGTSACGATAAINALFALEVPFTLEVLVKGVATKLRETGVPLSRYLMSRSIAGATHRDIARGIFSAANGMVITKFFAFYPERKISLSHWLHYWISRGAAPIATLNLQHCGEGKDIPDAWHHQMIFGVGQAGIYMTNPLQCMPEQILWHQLVSPSVLLIRRADVLAHWNETTDLTPLMLLDHMWRRINVLGQVVNIVREAMLHAQQDIVATPSASHIRIPASYQAGITLVMRADSPASSELLRAEQLPLL